MATKAHAQAQPTQISISQTLNTWATNFRTQSRATFTKLELRDYIRLVIIVGGYMLLRPYLMKIGARLQERAHEKDSAEVGSVTNTNEGKGANAEDIRSGGGAGRGAKKAKIHIPGVESEDEEGSSGEEDGQGVGAGKSWGRKATLRQRKMIRERLEAVERRLEGELEGSDVEIEEFLVD